MSDETLDGHSSQGSDFEATQFFESTEYSKKERDIAFAVEILGSTTLTERQLSSALSTWTLHGVTSLADHLVQKGLITPKIQTDLEYRASLQLKAVEERVTRESSADQTHDSQRNSVMSRLDDTGRVARLLGISEAVTGITSEEGREDTNRFKLIRKLGQGGLGTVWLARDLKINRYVALKEIRDVASSSQAAQDRFKREAEITGRLEHPGVVPIYQVGEDTTTGLPFYTMRFLGKQTLQDAITEYHERREDGDDDPMLLRKLLTSFVSVCQAIGHAHSRKIIHRDLKPENVTTDSFGQVMVIDWGLAKILDEGAVEEGLSEASGYGDLGSGDRTVAGQVLGSPMYMAPEQASGRIDEIDESTDIFGLGAILFSILTGFAPHEQTRDQSASTTTTQLMDNIAAGNTPMASLSNAHVDPALEAICAKAMAKKRYARYSSTTGLAEDVQRWMAGEPVSAYEEKLTQRIGRWVQHHQRLSQVIAASLTIIMVAAATLTISARQNEIATQHAFFEEFKSHGREVEVQLETAGKNLSGDVRFMSSLPPIQGIILARAGAEESEGEEIWRTRLETIYEGLLRANPEYLAVTYISAGEEDSTATDTEYSANPHEIVRVERHATDLSYIRRVPKSRLAELTLSESFTDTLKMEPGDVKISFAEKHSETERGRNRKKLIASIPIYDDQSGDIFGLVTIETDISRQIQNMLNNLDERLGEIYITDSAGELIVVSNPEFGVQLANQEHQLPKLITESGFFAATSTKRFLSDNTSYVAHRIQLDPADPASSIGIVLQLSDQE